MIHRYVAALKKKRFEQRKGWVWLWWVNELCEKKKKIKRMHRCRSVLFGKNISEEKNHALLCIYIYVFVCVCVCVPVCLGVYLIFFKFHYNRSLPGKDTQDTEIPMNIEKFTAEKCNVKKLEVLTSRLEFCRCLKIYVKKIKGYNCLSQKNFA